MKPGAPPLGYDQEQEESSCKGRLNLKPGTSAKRYQRCPPRRGNSMKPRAPPLGYDKEKEESPRSGSLNPSWKCIFNPKIKLPFQGATEPQSFIFPGRCPGQ